MFNHPFFKNAQESREIAAHDYPRALMTCIIRTLSIPFPGDEQTITILNRAIEFFNAYYRGERGINEQQKDFIKDITTDYATISPIHLTSKQNFDACFDPTRLPRGACVNWEAFQTFFKNVTQVPIPIEEKSAGPKNISP